MPWVKHAGYILDSLSKMRLVVQLHAEAKHESDRDRSQAEVPDRDFKGWSSAIATTREENNR